MARHLGLANGRGIVRSLLIEDADCPYCAAEGVSVKVQFPLSRKDSAHVGGWAPIKAWPRFRFGGCLRAEVPCGRCENVVTLDWDPVNWKWYHTVLAVIMAIVVIAGLIVSASAAKLFVVDNYACGNTQDWRSAGLSYGEALSVKDVEFAYGEDPKATRGVSFVIDNKKSSRLPVHVHWVVRSEIDGNLVVVGAASSDFELKLMKPGDNKFNMALHAALKTDAKEFYGCLAVAYEE